MSILIITLSFLSFMLIKYSPIDPVEAYIGGDIMRIGVEQREKIAEYWGLNKPPIEQFIRWASAAIYGDFGTSLIFRRTVLEIIKDGFIGSVLLMGISWLLSGILGFVLGIVAAVKEGTWIDKIIKYYCLILASTPTFWIGILLLIIFSVKLKWFPIGLGVPAGVLNEDVTFGSYMHHLVLPVMALSLLGVANIALHTRQKLLEILESDYILFAKARGERGALLIWRHGIRNILLPALTLQFSSFSELFGGAVLAEQVFSYPGLGQLTVQAGLRGDVPLLLGIVIFSAIFVFVGNLIADFLYTIVDPRMRGGAI